MKALFYFLSCFICHLAIAQTPSCHTVLGPQPNCSTTLCIDNININCPNDGFYITGSFTSDCITTNQYLLEIFDGNGNFITITTTVDEPNDDYSFYVPIDDGTFGTNNPSGIYNFNVYSSWNLLNNPDIPPVPSLSFPHTISGANINFNNCQDPCEDISITITNENQLPSCLELNSYWNHEIIVSINLPSGYGYNELVSDYTNGNLYMNIFDTNNDASPFFTETSFSNWDQNEIENDGVFNYTYTLESHGNMSNMTDTTYRFEIIANLNGECPLSESITIGACEDTVDPCEFLGISFDYLDNTPDCNIFENGDTYQICGNFSALDGIGHNMSLRIESIDNPSDNFWIPITPDPNSINISDGVVTGSFCVDLNESDFNLNDDSYSISKHIGYSDNSILCNTAQVSYPIPLNDCVDPDPCLLNTYIDGNKFCWEGESDFYYVEIISDSTCDNGIKPEEESTIFTFTTNENCIDLFEMVGEVDNKCFRIRVKADKYCPWTECLIGVVPQGSNSNPESYFIYFGSCFTTNQRASTNIDSEQVKISPNPAINEILISSENSKIASIIIYSVYGKQVKVVEEINALDTKVNLSHLPKGYYMVKVTFENNTSQHKNIILK